MARACEVVARWLSLDWGSQRWGSGVLWVGLTPAAGGHAAGEPERNRVSVEGSRSASVAFHRPGWDESSNHIKKQTQLLSTGPLKCLPVLVLSCQKVWTLCATLNMTPVMLAHTQMRLCSSSTSRLQKKYTNPM